MIISLLYNLFFSVKLLLHTLAEIFFWTTQNHQILILPLKIITSWNIKLAVTDPIIWWVLHLDYITDRNYNIISFFPGENDFQNRDLTILLSYHHYYEILNQTGVCIPKSLVSFFLTSMSLGLCSIFLYTQQLQKTWSDGPLYTRKIV